MDGMPTSLADQQEPKEWSMNSISVDPYSVQAALDALVQIEAEKTPRTYCDMCLKPCRTGPGGLCRACHRLEHSECEDY